MYIYPDIFHRDVCPHIFIDRDINIVMYNECFTLDLLVHIS